MRSPRNQSVLQAFNRYTRAYFQRWLLIGVLIGIVAGIGAIIFYSAIAVVTHWLLGGIAGFVPPSPAGEGNTVVTPIAHRWLIPVVTTLGGLLTGFIVFTLAPEAEGHGTDAAIEAFHEKGGRIRSRIPIIKLVASAITIGSGGSAGREGPTAQISAGFGSWLGDLLHLDDQDRRIAVAAGIGSGIGAIFKAPFGGALLSAEILYTRDFEADALFPSFIASVVGFSIYGAWDGWTPVFGTGAHYQFTHVSNLVGYLILGLCAGGVGILYPKTLYGIRDLFHHIHIPNHFKPAIGGLAVGLIGLFVPQALGMGYGYAQFAINGDFVQLSAWLMLALVFVKILTTSLTIGTGGSGGVFGPGMVIGGFLGAAIWAGLHAVAPGLVAGTNAGAFAVVGMGAFFGGIAKAPLAVILMVAEMTGEYALIAPAMLATMVAYLITGDTSIYESQVPTRLDSPAHKDDYALPLLQSLTVRDALIKGIEGALATAAPETPLSELSKLIRERNVMSVPIIEQGKLIGLVTASDLARVPPLDVNAGIARARQVMSRSVVRAFPDETLYTAWLRMSRRGFRQLAVVERANPSTLIGVITLDSIAQLLRVPSRTRVAPQTTPATQAETVAALSATKTQAVAVARQRSAEDGRGTSAVATDIPADGQAMSTSNDRAGDDHHVTAAVSHLSRAAATGDPFSQMRVGEAMLRTPPVVREQAPLAQVRGALHQYGVLLVVDDAERLQGIITPADLEGREDVEQGKSLTAADVAVRNLVTTTTQDTLRIAVRRMTRLGLRQLPVVEGPMPARAVGLLRRSDVLAAYGRSLLDEKPAVSASAR